MKLAKVAAAVALATASVGFMSTALANHFTVNGSENGSFSISGTVVFGQYGNAKLTTTTFFPDNQSDTDTPADNGTPITLGVTTNGTLTQYTCTVTMGGSVVSGVASITSMHTSGSELCDELVPSNFPWRLHTLSAGNYSAVAEGIAFYHTGVFSCMAVSVGVGLQPGLLGFGGPLQQGGCYLQTPMALTVTPTLEIVSD
jgi:hypothetical protein